MFSKLLSEISKDIGEINLRLLNDENQKAIAFKKINHLKVDDVYSQSKMENFQIDEKEVTNETVASIVDVPTSGTWFNNTLDNYFSRPVHLIDFTVSETFLDFAFNPWVLWSRDPSVRTKLAKYAYFKGDLELTFSFSSNRFNYGSIIVSYQPTPNFNPTYKAYAESNTPATGANATGFNSYLLQSPESHLLNFSQDNNFVMDIPMIIPKKAVKLFNLAQVVDNSIDFDDFRQLGLVHVRTLNALLDVVSGAPSPITVQVYARCKSFDMGPISDTPMIINAQMNVDSLFDEFKAFMASKSKQLSDNSALKTAGNVGKQILGDEYEDSGPISGVASAVSTVANKLSAVPVIGGAAQATSVVASGVSKVAKFFGFSNPINLEHYSFFKNFPFNNISFMDFKDTATKLSSDPKQGLSISPFMSDENKDPLAINSISSKWGYFFTADWLTSSVPRVTNLVNIPLTPIICCPRDFFESYQDTPLSFCARPFRFWKGTLSFRFQVIASQVHRGKLAIVYEPNGAASIEILSKLLDFNRQLIYVMDIEEERDIQIDIGFAYDKPFARVTPNVQESFENSLVHTSTYVPSADCALLYDSGASIGTLYIVPFTDLNPNSLDTPTEKPVFINCYVKSDDIVFGSPYQLERANPTRSITLVPTAKDDSPEKVESQMQLNGKQDWNTDEPIKVINLNEVKTDFDDIFLRNFGEQIVSFRSLLNKGSICYTIIQNALEALNLPLYPSYNKTSGNFSYPETTPQTKFPALGSLSGNSISYFNLFTHLRSAFLYMNGGMRYRFTSRGGSKESQVIASIRHVYTGDPNGVIRTTAPYAINGSYLRTSFAGSAIFNPFLQGVELEIPYYSIDWFTPANPPPVSFLNEPYVTGNTLFTLDYSNWALQVPNVEEPLDVTFNTAEDFSFHRFQGAPLYFYTGNLGN